MIEEDRKSKNLKVFLWGLLGLLGMVILIITFTAFSNIRTPVDSYGDLDIKFDAYKIYMVLPLNLIFGVLAYVCGFFVARELNYHFSQRNLNKMDDVEIDQQINIMNAFKRSRGELRAAKKAEQDEMKKFARGR